MIILITQYFHITDPLIGLVTFSKEPDQSLLESYFTNSESIH